MWRIELSYFYYLFFLITVKSTCTSRGKSSSSKSPTCKFRKIWKLWGKLVWNVCLHLIVSSILPPLVNFMDRFDFVSNLGPFLLKDKYIVKNFHDMGLVKFLMCDTQTRMTNIFLNFILYNNSLLLIGILFQYININIE